jgi:endonuclease/exonuclease/phosphatase (EEP) superfamily protein YafD
MQIFYVILSVLLIIVHFLPYSKNQHWFFRLPDFLRIQLLFLQIVVLAAGWFIVDSKSLLFWVVQLLLLGVTCHNLGILIHYTPIFRVLFRPRNTLNSPSKVVTILSANVYQFNEDYEKLIHLIESVEPDIVLTMESDSKWEKALNRIERSYPNALKVAQDNTYGMHFYTRLTTHDAQVHYFVSDDIPSIEADLETDDGYRFTFFGVHPPPPSPTEEETSKERDGELMVLAKKIAELDVPVIVVGDFNNVAWSRSSKLFRKTSGLIDPRIGRGFYPTFHARSKLVRFPIDLVFHSSDIVVIELKTLDDIGSDHLPLLCRFMIAKTPVKQSDVPAELNEQEAKDVEEMIRNGKNENGHRDTNRTD